LPKLEGDRSESAVLTSPTFAALPSNILSACGRKICLAKQQKGHALRIIILGVSETDNIPNRLFLSSNIQNTKSVEYQHFNSEKSRLCQIIITEIGLNFS